MDELGSAMSAGRGKLSGRLRLSAPNLLGRLVVAPLLPRFLELHPDVAVDLLLVDRVVNLVEEGLHLALRVGRLPDSSLVARKLGDIQMVTCAAPAYLAHRGTPRTLDDLRKHDCLVFSDAPGPVDWRFQSRAVRTCISVTGRIWMNSLDALVSASIQGAGIVRAPAWQVAEHIESGRLRRVLEKYAPPATPVHELFERVKLSSPKIRAFADYLVDQWPTG